MTEPSLGIIGCGAAAKKYYLPVLKKYPEICKNLYFVDKNLNQAKKLAAEFNSQNFTDDYHNIINKVQSAIIAVPHFCHYSISMDFLRNGIHVLCEKPIAESSEEAKEMEFIVKMLVVGNRARTLALNIKKRI